MVPLTISVWGFNTRLSTHLLNAQKKPTRATQQSIHFGKRRFRKKKKKKEAWRMGQKQKRDRKMDRTNEKNKRKS